MKAHALLASLVLCASAHAAIERGTYTGEFTDGRTFSSPINTSFLIDRDAAPIAFDPGANIWGYSRAALSGFAFAYGAASWTQADIFPLTIGGTYTADFWLDTPLTGTPTRMFLRADNASGQLLFDIYKEGVLTDISFVSFAGVPGADPGFARFSIAPVPEPETYSLMLAGLVAIGWTVRRRASTSARTLRKAHDSTGATNVPRQRAAPQ